MKLSVMEKILILLYTFGLHWAIEVVPEWHETTYFNPKYIEFLSVTFRKYSRNGPHFINLELKSFSGVGNNLTLKLALYEFLGGHYIQTPIQAEVKLCDFLQNEPFIGQMYYRQVKQRYNLTCPFPEGEYHLMNLTIHLENFPYNIPFTYSSLIVKIRLDLEGIATETREKVFMWRTFDKLTQKVTPNAKGSKKNIPKVLN